MLKVLLIDDDKYMTDMVAYLFKSVGVNNITKKNSALVALKYLKVCNKKNLFPHIIIVDLCMPEMDGFQFIQQYETLYRNNSPKLSVYILTNSISGKNKEKAFKFSSVKKFLKKPITLELIKMIVENRKK